MTKRNIALLVFLLVLSLAACSGGPSASTDIPASPVTVTPTPAPTPTPNPTPTPDPIRDRVEGMTDAQLAGQLLIAGVEGTTPGEDARTAVEELGVSGIILFGRNVETAGQLAALTEGLNALNKRDIPLFLCVDEEGGSVSRLGNLEGPLPKPYDYMRDYLARSKAAGEGRVTTGTAEDYGAALAARCAKYGINVDFAPSLDVWSNPQNTVIGKRSYGSDAATASLAVETAMAMVRGGVIPVGKHFPGHGDTLVDSHVGLPVVDKPVGELEELELVPFRKAIDRGIPALMVAHILMTQLDPDLPATLSPAVVEGLLRTGLGFDGVVFTDDMTMGAIAQGWGLGEAAVLAVNAGCDQVLVCHGADNLRTAYDALLAALADGSLPRRRAEESVYRVLSLKATLN